MHKRQQFPNVIFGASLRPHSATLAILTMLLFLLLGLLFLLLTPQPAQGQTYQVIHAFTGGEDGGNPATGLTIDAAGNLYGTATGGGVYNHGVVFKLKRTSAGWVLNPLYSFAAGNDGAGPEGRVSLAKDGTLYGTTNWGGGNGCVANLGCGTVFHLTPAPSAPKSVLAPWNETVLYRFAGGNDGASPEGDLTFDQSGNIYGTTLHGGGSNDRGTVYELIQAGGGWTETVLYSGDVSSDGGTPSGGVIFDKAGNLYGVSTDGGPAFWGTVYELSRSGSSWTEQTLYSFTGGNDGGDPGGGLIFDASGNLYGTAFDLGSGGGGTVYQLTPVSGGWSFNLLYSLFNPQRPYGGPVDKLIMDAAGNLYGTTLYDDGSQDGSVFKLTPSSGGWSYTSLHDFRNLDDGSLPMCSLVFDANGNIYGTASQGGQYGYGVVWEITP
jgi:uncharacterized repeat protein (TIGR03803 family)